MSENQPYDRGARWLLAHHPDALLRMAGVGPIVSWRACAADVVQPLQQPDGLIELRIAGRDELVYAVIEVNTYPDRRSVEQARTDALMVLMARGALPEVVVVVLCPRGTYRTEDREEVTSALGTTRLEIRWRVVNLWEHPADRLLEMNDPGAVPWVPLAQSSAEDAPALLRRCRELLDEAPESERANLLAVTWVLASLRYNLDALRAVFGRRQTVIESPFIQDLLSDPEVVRNAPAIRQLLADPSLVSQSPAAQALVAQQAHRTILRVLTARFQAVPPAVVTALSGVVDTAALDELTDLAAICPDLPAFIARLPA